MNEKTIYVKRISRQYATIRWKRQYITRSQNRYQQSSKIEIIYDGSKNLNLFAEDMLHICLFFFGAGNNKNCTGNTMHGDGWNAS